MAATGREPEPRRGLVIGLLADPDLPGELAQRLATQLPTLLAGRGSEVVSWKVGVLTDPLSGVQPDRNHIVDTAREWIPGQGGTGRSA